MSINETYEALRTLKLDGMADVFAELAAQNAKAPLDPTQWVSHMVEREKSIQDARRLQSRLRASRLRHADATMDNVDFTAERTLDRAGFEALRGGAWIETHRTVLMSGHAALENPFWPALWDMRLASMVKVSCTSGCRNFSQS